MKIQEEKITEVEEILNKMDDAFLKAFKPRWIEMISFYAIQIIFEAIFLYGLFFAYRAGIRSLPFAAIYLAVAYAAVSNLMRTVELIIKDIKFQKFYNETKAKRGHRMEDFKKFIDESGEVKHGKKV